MTLKTIGRLVAVAGIPTPLQAGAVGTRSVFVVLGWPGQRRADRTGGGLPGGRGGWPHTQDGESRRGAVSYELQEF